MSDETLLILSGMGIPLYSARGLTQTLEPIEASANLRRTINGNLRDLSFEQFRKYKTKISCTDQRAPAIDGIFAGMEVEVHCVHELCYPLSGSAQRTAVSGSERTEGDFVFYRPVLTMLITGVQSATDEYNADVQWELELEEV